MKTKTALILLTGMLVLSATSCGNSNNQPMQNSIQESTETNIQTESSESTTEQNNKIEVSLDVAVNENNGQPIFTVNTNLPDETDLMLSLSGEDYTGQAHAIVNSGIATSEQFSNKGKALKGKYVLSVSISEPRLQSDNVKEVIGENGENITGKYVKTSDTNNVKYVSGDFDFSFKDEQKDKIVLNAQEKDFVKKNASEIVVSSKMLLDRFISGYDIPMASQLWTIANFDEEGAVMATADITEESTGISQKAIIVLTPTIEEDKMTGCTPHYVCVGNTVYGNDGYCDEVFKTIEDAMNAINKE